MELEFVAQLMYQWKELGCRSQSYSLLILNVRFPLVHPHLYQSHCDNQRNSLFLWYHQLILSLLSGTRPVRAKQTLLDGWFGNSRKQTGSDFKATGLNLILHEDSDNDPESAEAVVLKTAPLAKKSRVV